VELTLIRKRLEPTFTGGELHVNGGFECYTLEDPVRAPGIKIPGDTAIPFGTYQLELRWSGTFKRMMPYLRNVPHFEDVMLHWGNTSQNTRGCILVANIEDWARARVLKSVDAFNGLWPRLTRQFTAADEPVTIAVIADRGGSP